MGSSTKELVLIDGVFMYAVDEGNLRSQGRRAIQ
jgi:hypothetical protein